MRRMLDPGSCRSATALQSKGSLDRLIGRRFPIAADLSARGRPQAKRSAASKPCEQLLMIQVLHEHVIAGGCALRYLSQARREFWERRWINEVFSFGHDLRFREVLVLNTWDPYEDLLRSVTDHGRLILVIIDERDHFPRALMRQFGAVIRVGFDYGDYPPNTLTIPLYLPEPTFLEAGDRTFSSDFDSRTYLWSFAGDGHKNRDRREMLSAFSPSVPATNTSLEVGSPLVRFSPVTTPR